VLVIQDEALTSELCPFSGGFTGELTADAGLRLAWAYGGHGNGSNQPRFDDQRQCSCIIYQSLGRRRLHATGVQQAWHASADAKSPQIICPAAVVSMVRISGSRRAQIVDPSGVNRPATELRRVLARNLDATLPLLVSVGTFLTVSEITNPWYPRGVLSPPPEAGTR